MRVYFMSSTRGHLCVKVTSDQVSTEGDDVLLYANKEGDKFTTYAAAQRLNDLFGSAVRLAREKSYEQGYSDGRAKRSKAKWHRSVL